MMFEQDYIMRVIKEIVRTLIKLLFNIDMEKPTDEILEKQIFKDRLKILLDMIEMGEINEAENEIYAMIDEGEKEGIKTALLFYSYLNEKDDEFLKSHSFSREEIREGLEYIAGKCGTAHLVELY